MKKPSRLSEVQQCAIYQIKNIINNKIYIGSTESVDTRFNEHMSTLIRNKHHSPKLQYAWNKYGKDKFEFSILEHPHKDLLLLREQYYLDTLLYASENDNRFYKMGYNCRRIAESNRGYKWSEDSKKKLSKSLKGKLRGEKHPLAKINEKIVKDILLTVLNTNLTNTQIAKDFKISKTNINDIIRGKVWGYIKLDNSYDQDRLNELRNHLQKLSSTKMIGRGENHNMSKFSESDIMKIRRLVSTGITQTRIAKIFNTKQGTISNIVHNRIWKHIDWLQQSLYNWLRSPAVKEIINKGIDVDFGVSTVYLIERLVLSHIRLWHLEDKIRLTNNDKERSEIKRQIDYINSKIRPRLISAIESSLIKAYIDQDMTIIGDGNLKHYGKEFEEEINKDYKA